MAVNSGQIDLNSDAVLFDRENEVLGFNSSGSSVSVGVFHSETLRYEPVGGEVLNHDQKVFHVGDDRGANGSLELPSEPVVVGFHMNPGCDVMINGSGKEGFGEETELVVGGNSLEAGVEAVDGGYDGKVGDFSNLLVKNEDEKKTIEGSARAPFVYGGAEPDKALVFYFNDGVQNEPECEKTRKVTETAGSLSTEVASNNEAQGVDNNLTECKQKIKNSTLVNLSAVVEDDIKMKAADVLVTKDGLEDSRASEIRSYHLQDDIPYMEVIDLNAKESLPLKDSLSRNRLELETPYELKQPAFQLDAQAEVMQNHTMDIDMAEPGLFENIQNECHGINLVVDLNSYRNMQEVGMYRESVFSELSFYVSDLVWGKVRGHPWWPGQIFDPSAASEMAKRHLKEDCYLIAYFGDQTFSWNDVSMIKPFQPYFSQMEKQSDLEEFQHAVDSALYEVSRRVEFGLSCPCMPEEVFSELKTQAISNAGIRQHTCRRNGGGRFTDATSFEPMKLVNYVKSLAQSPYMEYDRLDFVIARAQLLSFYRSKGYSQLPEFAVLGPLFENDVEIQLMREREKIDEQELKTHLGFSQKHKLVPKDSKQPSKKLKLLSDLMSDRRFCIPNGEHASERKSSYESISRCSRRKQKEAYDTSHDYFRNSKKRKLAQLQYVSTDEMWSQLCLAAKDPFGECCLSDAVYFFAEFRNFISLDDSASMEHGMSLEQMHDGETRVTATEAAASMTSAMEPCNDSYWTDRIIQTFSEEQSLSKSPNEREEFFPVTPTEANSPSSKSQPGAEINTNSSFMQQDTDRNLGSEPSKLMEHLDESSEEGIICPTAFTLKFTNLDSVPSTTDLNKIFGRFGPLIESKTELIKKTSCARVVFKKRSDAETAFSSAGKYRIFGPSLVSYRLKILPRPPKKVTGKRGRKSKKEKASVDGAAV
ncbi:PWWP domain-containing protein 5 [Gastrolobium bilobum]|uniref:PWWP domain-containing protein 5 n=1 Tax=Gastrolobium bilobum TaxID=150636 RepID=UPI002AB0E0DA|nr:PWWP domain-containing protein 5 [Gastrolobium bilobum]